MTQEHRCLLGESERALDLSCLAAFCCSLPMSTRGTLDLLLVEPRGAGACALHRHSLPDLSLESAALPAADGDGGRLPAHARAQPRSGLPDRGGWDARCPRSGAGSKPGSWRSHRGFCVQFWHRQRHERLQRAPSGAASADGLRSPADDLPAGIYSMRQTCPNDSLLNPIVTRQTLMANNNGIL